MIDNEADRHSRRRFRRHAFGDRGRRGRAGPRRALGRIPPGGERLDGATVKLAAPDSAPAQDHLHRPELSRSRRSNRTCRSPKRPTVFAKFPDRRDRPRRIHRAAEELHQAGLRSRDRRGDRPRRPPYRRRRWRDHVFGYTCLNDVSARDFQMATSQWMIGKTFDTFARSARGSSLPTKSRTRTISTSA